MYSFLSVFTVNMQNCRCRRQIVTSTMVKTVSSRQFGYPVDQHIYRSTRPPAAAAARKRGDHKLHGAYF